MQFCHLSVNVLPKTTAVILIMCIVVLYYKYINVIRYLSMHASIFLRWNGQNNYKDIIFILVGPNDIIYIDVSTHTTHNSTVISIGVKRYNASQLANFLIRKWGYYTENILRLSNIFVQLLNCIPYMVMEKEKNC